MKMKFYLRGMGTGVIITALVFMVAFAVYQPKMSDAEIETAAAKLGMVKESSSSNSSKTDSDSSKTDSTTKTNADGSKTTTTTVKAASDSSSDTSKSSTENAGTSDSSDTSQNSATAYNAGDMVSVAITGGESSTTVAQNLYNSGLVDNADSFDSYLDSNGYDNSIRPGTYQIKKGSSYSDIAGAISSKK